MLRSRRRSSSLAARAAGAIAALAVFGLAGCASHQKPAKTPPPPGEVYRSLLGHNAGLTSMRAVVEAHLSFAGQDVSLPGVLLLDSFGGFRLEVLDPLDRPMAILFAEGGRIIHYRPGPGLAASLGVFPGQCRGVDPADWVSAILASSIVPVAGEGLVDRGLWGGGRTLERRRGGELHQSIRYDDKSGEPIPRLISWYCAEDPVLQVVMREWIHGSTWRLPSRFDIQFPGAGLAIGMELREIEGNPPPSNQPFRPRLGSEIKWTGWNIPQ